MNYQELADLIEKLRNVPEVDLLELLELSSEELLEFCIDRVFELQSKLYRYVETQ